MNGQMSRRVTAITDPRDWPITRDRCKQSNGLLPMPALVAPETVLVRASHGASVAQSIAVTTDLIDRSPVRLLRERQLEYNAADIRSERPVNFAARPARISAPFPATYRIPDATDGH
jgi:hypothetical protein